MFASKSYININQSKSKFSGGWLSQMIPFDLAGEDFQVRRSVSQVVASNAFGTPKAENGTPVRCPVLLVGEISPDPFVRFFETGCAPCRRFFTHTEEPPSAISARQVRAHIRRLPCGSSVLAFHPAPCGIRRTGCFSRLLDG